MAIAPGVPGFCDKARNGGRVDLGWVVPALWLYLLTKITEIYTAAHVRLFDDSSAAYLAGLIKGILTESGPISTRFAIDVFRSIPASLHSHFFESRFYRMEKTIFGLMALSIFALGLDLAVLAQDSLQE